MRKRSILFTCFSFLVISIGGVAAAPSTRCTQYQIDPLQHYDIKYARFYMQPFTRLDNGRMVVLRCAFFPNDEIYIVSGRYNQCRWYQRTCQIQVDQSPAPYNGAFVPRTGLMDQLGWGSARAHR